MQAPRFLTGSGLVLCAAGACPGQVPDGPATAVEASALVDLQNGPPPEPLSNTTYKTYFRDGARMETNDLQFSLRIGGRLNVDWMFLSGDSELEAGEDLGDKTDLRRLHLFTGGTLYESVEYFAQFDFAPAVSPVTNGTSGEQSTVLVKDAYLSLPGFGPGSLTIGQQFEPFGLETQTPQNHNTFMERSLADSLTPRRGTGLKYAGQNSGQTFNWALGVFNSNTANSPDPEYPGDDSWGGTGRVTYAFDNLGGNRANLVHLGAAYSGRSADGLAFRTRPEAFTEAPWIDTGLALADAKRVAQLGLELAAIFGPFSVQGEFMQARVDSVAAGDPSVDGYYLQASYFLTGETRGYSNGIFERVRPISNWKGFGDGLGAFELALRVSEADYSEALIGQALQNYTFAINWYLNPSVRFQTNYTLSESEEYTNGSANILGFRWEIAF
jgi:phosphate-selective porin OprO and OprP